ncbi:MAG: CBS domain-containing protein [Pseudonocardiales bacterium]
MKAREIMTRDVATVHTATSVRHAAELLTERGVTSLPVLDDDDRVVGIVSEVDLIRDRMPHDPRSHLRPEAHEQPDPARLVRDVMSGVVVCLGENADSADVAALMLENHVRAVPVVDGGRLVGIVSRRDLLRTLLRDDDAIRTEVSSRLTDYAGESGRWTVDVNDGIVAIRGRFDGSTEEIVTVLARTVPGVLRVHTYHPAV